MLEIVLKQADVHLIVFNHGAFTSFFAINEATIEFAAIRPHLAPLSHHHSLLKIANIGHLLFSEVVLALAMELIIHEIAFEVAAIVPNKVTQALLGILHELTFKATSRLFPGLRAMPIHSVVEPFTLIGVALIGDFNNPVPISLIVLEVALIELAIASVVE